MSFTQRRRSSRWLLILALALLVGAITAFAVAADPDSRLVTEPGARPTPGRDGPVSLGPIRQMRVGAGAESALVFWRGPLAAIRPVVVFLHGWGVQVDRYRPWIDHLVRTGNSVVAPRYQTSSQSPPAGVRAAAARGVRRALRRLSLPDRTLVLAGHSAGAALAADLAAVGAGGRLPAASAIFAVYPGRAILGYPGGIPALSLDGLAPSTRLLALAGANDKIVAQVPAQQLVASASTLPAVNRRYHLVTDPRVDDHYAPTGATRAARRAFWRRLDRLIAVVRP